MGKLINVFVSYYDLWAAGFQIIKQMLPAEAREMIKFLKKSNNNEYVTEDQRLQSWGGELIVTHNSAHSMTLFISPFLK